jgi:hypothetical protein
MKYLLFALAFTSFLTGCSRENAVPRQDPQLRQAPVSVPSFDGKEAFGYLKAQTDFGPRIAGSTAHQNCLNYMESEMKQSADAVNLQTFEVKGYDGERLNLTNVISSFNSSATTRILLVAHWDSRPRADQDPDPKKRNQPILGANDAASGVAILMEIGRQLKLHPPAAGVDMLFDDGEDYGKEGDNSNYLLGTRYFAKNLPPGFHPEYGILLDMVGDKQLELLREPNSIRYAPDVVDLVWSTAKDLGIYQFVDEVQRPVLDDHLPLIEAGIKTIDLIDFNYPDASNRYWHTTQDTPDKCSPESLEAVGTVLLHLIYKQPA